MPTYSYKCFACGHQFEEMQKISEPAITLCPSCGKEEVKRLISATAFHLKGSGWYKTDYASSSSSSTSSSSSSNSSTSNSVSSDSTVKEQAKSEAPAAPSTTSDSSSGSTSGGSSGS